MQLNGDRYRLTSNIILIKDNFNINIYYLIIRIYGVHYTIMVWQLI